MPILRFIVLLFGAALLVIGYRRRKKAKQESPTPSRAGIILIATGAIVCAIAVAGFVMAALRGPGIAAGACIKFDGTSAGGGTVNVVDCGLADSLLQVGAYAANGQQCPAVQATEQIEGASYYRISKGQAQGSALCILPNLREGLCYSQNEDGSKISAVDCTSKDPQVFRVQKRVDGSADPAACNGVSPVFIAYAQPPRVYCLAPTR